MTSSSAPARGRPGSRPPIRDVPEREVRENTPLVHHTLHRMLRAGKVQRELEYDDLFQIGMLGLWEALRRWRPELGARSTYCVSYIRGYVMHHQRTTTRATGWSRAAGRRLATLTSLHTPVREDRTLLDVLAGNAGDVADTVHWRFEMHTLSRRVAELREPYRTLARRNVIAGEPANAIAAETGQDARFVQNACRRLRRHLRDGTVPANWTRGADAIADTLREAA